MEEGAPDGAFFPPGGRRALKGNGFSVRASGVRLARCH